MSRRAGFPLAFGGLTTSGGAPLTSFVGTRRQSLNGLLIEPREGLGGRALVERQPVSAIQYRQAATITHRYDREVLAEDIVSLLAVPVIVDGTVRAVLYGGHRVATQLSDSVIGQSIKVAQGLAWEYSVRDEVERRIALMETEGAPGSRNERTVDDREHLRDLYTELREIARNIVDPGLARRLEAVGESLGRTVRRPADSGSLLSPREMDVLAQAALGKRNAHIGLQLGLQESTVKSYVSSAMRKLGATNRYQAVILCRRLGLIP
jgi:DNA-binding CsgD family transcriptional regulator